MKIGYQGIAGSYSEAAVLQYRNRVGKEKDWQLEGKDSFPELVEGVIHEKIDAAMMPVENSTTGIIHRSMDLFRAQPVIATAEVYQTVQHTLWGLPGSRLEDLTEVYSHPEALSQCQDFFKDHPWLQPIAYTDTAQAARFVQEEGNPRFASLSGPSCGELYNLIPLKQNIQTEETNTTRFFLMESFRGNSKEIGRDLQKIREANPACSRLMLYVETPHEPGALAKLLNTFNLFDCNLEGLNARPIKNKPFSYGFFIEADISTVGIDLNIFWQTLLYACNVMQLIAFFEPVDSGIKEE